MNKIAQYAGLGIAGLLSCTAYAVDTVTELLPSSGVYGMMLADTRGMDHRDDCRDDRRDDRGDRQDCRQEENVVGRDKRNCKQDERQDDRRGNDNDD